MSQVFKRFKHWFVNVYWYHYKWTLFVAIIAVLGFKMFQSDLLNAVDFDYEMIVTSRVMLVQEQFDEVTQLMEDTVGDVNGDGESYSYINLLNFTGGEMGQANTIKFNALVIDQSITLYILDEETADTYMVEGLFEPLSTFGFTGTDGDEYFIVAQDIPLFERAGLKTVSQMQDTNYYICFRAMTESASKDPDIMASYGRSAEILRAILSAQ